MLEVSKQLLLGPASSILTLLCPQWVKVHLCPLGFGPLNLAQECVQRQNQNSPESPPRWSPESRFWRHQAMNPVSCEEWKKLGLLLRWSWAQPLIQTEAPDNPLSTERFQLTGVSSALHGSSGSGSTELLWETSPQCEGSQEKNMPSRGRF